MGSAPARLSAALVDRYRIERELGAGGMATVYLAHDLRHDRDVAIKVLHPELAAALGSERFLSEIKTTAKLQHPHILPLLDSGDGDGLLYYVMPYVAGETLRARLERERQLPIEDALRIAREVADALGSAHALGVIHRDIKPENILLQGGHALVADFGIALAVQTAGGARMTQTGLSLGTPQYMSPEQAVGDRNIDARSDIYALGAVTYEMLTGEPPFTGATVQAIVAKVIAEKPAAPSTVRDTVTPTVERAVLRALAKLPADRFTTAVAFADALVATSAATWPGAPIARPASRRRLLVLGLGAAALAGGGFAGGRMLRSSSDAPLGALGRSIQVTWEPGLEITPAISPDGKLTAYAAGNGTRFKIFVRPVVGGRAVPLTDDSVAVETHPQWSHDGARILFVRNGQVFSAPSGGGPPRQEVPTRGGYVESATWSPDEHRIAYAVEDSLFIRQADGSTHRVATLYQPALCTWGSSDLIACAAGNRLYLRPGIGFGNASASWIAIVRVADGRVTALTDSSADNESPRWSPDGRWVFYASNRLGVRDIFATRVSDQGTATGETRRITVGLGVGSFSLSGDGARLAYAVINTSSNVWSLPWTGRPPDPGEGPKQVTFGQQNIESVSVAPDGRTLYYASDLAGNVDLYRMAIPSGVPDRLTSDPANEFAPDPSPDGRRVAFHSWRTASREVYILPLDGGPVEQVTRTPEQEVPPVWSPDGTTLAFCRNTRPGACSLARRAADKSWQIRVLVRDGYWAHWSPDGRFLSYSTDMLGGGLRVVPADSGAPRRLYDELQPGAPQAETSVWSPDGRTIFFSAHTAAGDAGIWSVPSGGGVPARVVGLGDERLRASRWWFAINQKRLYFLLYDRQSNVSVMEIGPLVAPR